MPETQSPIRLVLVGLLACTGMIHANLFSVAGHAQEIAHVAGKTAAEYTALLNSPQREVRLRAARSLARFGDQTAPQLRKTLSHSDPAMRYIAAEALGDLGGDSLLESIDQLTELQQNDEMHSVRLAASYALCRAGKLDRPLQFMIKTLDYPERGMACASAFLIGQIGPSAIEAKAALEKTLDANRPGTKGGDYHLGGEAINALRKLEAATTAQTQSPQKN